MMKLLSNPLSPYGRKVKIAMALKGLKDRIEIVQVDTNPADNPRSTGPIRWPRFRRWWSTATRRSSTAT